jgi:hypothetical protein
VTTSRGSPFTAEALAHQLVEPELVRPADLADPVQRLAHRDAPDPGGDVVGRHRLDQGGREADLPVDGAEVRDGLHELGLRRSSNRCST